jgi:signal transduction histidine kinase
MTDNFRCLGRGSIVRGLGRQTLLVELDRLRLEVAELRASRTRLVVAADGERRSIERALHEDVQQYLVGLAANLELAAGLVDGDPAAAKTLLAEMVGEAQQALEGSRKLAHRIYPPLLEAGGLGAALRSAAMGRAAPTPIEVPAGTAYSPEVAGIVYFCYLDVLDQAGAGTLVAVTVRSQQEGLLFEVIADCDLDADRLPLRDRVEALGGRLTIRSEPGHRTRVAGSLPLSR